jgi:hypothetical protein
MEKLECPTLSPTEVEHSILNCFLLKLTLHGHGMSVFARSVLLSAYEIRLIAIDNMMQRFCSDEAAVRRQWPVIRSGDGSIGKRCPFVPVLIVSAI